MRKTIFFCAMLSMSVTVAAQDTVRYLDSCYLFTDPGILGRTIEYPCTALGFNPVCEGSVDGPNGPIGAAVHDIYAVANRRQDPHPQTSRHPMLYGIAVTPAGNDEATAFDMDKLRMYAFHRVQLGATLYDLPTPWSAAWTDTLRPSNAGCIKQRWFAYDTIAADSTQGSKIAHCIELYFENPVPIGDEDTFYIGIAMCGNYLTYGVDTTSSQCRLSGSPIENAVRSVCNRNGELILPWNAAYEWFTLAQYWGGIFPIVELRCNPPHGLTLSEGNPPVAVWDGSGDLYQVSVCRHAPSPDMGRLSLTANTYFTLSHLDPDSAYAIHVRSACLYGNDTAWSSWSGPLAVGDTSVWASIEQPATEVFSITPNPATSSVAVSSGHGLLHVDVFNAAGAPVFSKDCALEHSLTLDTRPWPAGQYRVVAETPSGKASKPLSIVR